MDYYPGIKKNAFESFLMRWMNPEPIIQSEVSQKEKDKYCTLTYISTSALLIMLKPLILWITTNCGKFFKRWEY